MSSLKSEGFQEWTIKLRVDDKWIADGYYATASRIKECLMNDLRFAYDHEVEVEILERPNDHVVANLQGYKNVKQMLEDNPTYREDTKI